MRSQDRSTILLVDDEALQRSVLAGHLKKQRHSVIEAGSVQEALEKFAHHSFDIVFTDYKMPGKTGFDLLKEVKLRQPETAVVIMTAFGTIEGAVSAIREGAFDYISKPVNLDELDILIQRITERQLLLSENTLLKSQLAEKFSFSGIISHSSPMEQVLSTASRIAASRAPVLIRGESGTGKELLAQTIHYASERSKKPFIAVNCAALNENLLESELFGHEKGAFTGAERQHRGRFELADGGTLFLDEIGDIPPPTQVKLLRVLQEMNFERVGGTETISVDVRMIAATNRNLEQLIIDKVFREDLYYRLNVVSIEIPPLRHRREDISPLLDYYTARFAKENKKKKISFSKEAWDMLLRYDYPGNVRELENIIHRSVLLARGDTITSNELPASLQSKKSEIESLPPRNDLSLSAQVEQLEKTLVAEALHRASGNQSKAAKLLGISERNLRYRLNKWGMK